MQKLMRKRNVFMISDGTGITVESLGNSLLSQFESIGFEKSLHPFIDNLEKATKICSKINHCAKNSDERPLVFITLVDPSIAALIKKTQAFILDLFNTFLPPLETELALRATDTVGRAHAVANVKIYEQRIEAINYAILFDDGMKTQGYEKADIILIGVSRCGKTPSCLYMALQFGILAANYPITEEDLHNTYLPNAIKPYKAKLFGLTIDPKRLQQIRSERRPNSRYAEAQQCQYEILSVENIYKNEQIPYLNSTHYSIEEITAKIMSHAGLVKRI